MTDRRIQALLFNYLKRSMPIKFRVYTKQQKLCLERKGLNYSYNLACCSYQFIANFFSLIIFRIDIRFWEELLN